MIFWKFQAFRKFSPPPGFSTFFQFGYDQNLETASSDRAQGLSLMNDVDQESKCGAVTTFLITDPEIAWNSGSYFDLISWKTRPTKIPNKGQTLLSAIPPFFGSSSKCRDGYWVCKNFIINNELFINKQLFTRINMYQYYKPWKCLYLQNFNSVLT